MPNPAYRRTNSMAERNMRELAAKLEKMDCTTLWLQKMKNVFRMFDLDNTGYITTASMLTFVESVIKRSEMTQKDAEDYRSLLASWFQDTSTRSDVKIGFMDFAKMRYVLISDPELLQEYRWYMDGSVHLNFRVLDTDRDGYLSPKEWKVMYECMGIFDEELQKKSFDVLDENKDGLISLEEFLKASYEFSVNMEPTKYDIMMGPLPDVSEYQK